MTKKAKIEKLKKMKKLKKKKKLRKMTKIEKMNLEKFDRDQLTQFRWVTYIDCRD